MTSNSTTIQADLCRETLINDWVSANANSTEVQTLLAIQKTSLYAEIKSGCQPFIDEFNIQSGETCLLQQQTDGEITYSEFWGIGPANMDGDWSLAVDIMFSSNFTEIGTPIPCANSCYTDVNGIPGCESLKDLGLPAFGSVTQQRVCDMQWGDLDDAYNALRTCAAKLVGSKEMIAAYEIQSKTQNECSVAACMGEAITVDVVEGDAIVPPSTSNNDPTAESLPSSTSSSSPTSSSNRVVWSCSFTLVSVAALIGATM